METELAAGPVPTLMEQSGVPRPAPTLDLAAKTGGADFQEGLEIPIGISTDILLGLI